MAKASATWLKIRRSATAVWCRADIITRKAGPSRSEGVSRIGDGEFSLEQHRNVSVAEGIEVQYAERAFRRRVEQGASVAVSVPVSLAAGEAKAWPTEADEMASYMVERCAAVAATRAHFIETVDEQRLAREFRTRVERREVARPNVMAAGGCCFVLEALRLAGAGVAEQDVGRDIPEMR